ncbi:hypothetical protein Syun_002497 [Stephania yunnanensis]|uniref:Uncharacterized protein n=1 Tax=Stephania yunnanensis TaxID=152371 RepID=A0AAP0LHQ1_9MAGN
MQTKKSPSLTPQPSPQLNLNNSTSLLSPYHHHHKLSKSSATPITRRKMATSITSAAIVAGLGTSPLSSPKRVTLSSGFIKSRVAASNPLKQAMASGGRFTCFERDWLRRI